MVTILSTLVSLLSFRVRSRASLMLELVALRHQVTVMRRQHPGRLRLFSTDRLLSVWLYRIWPQVLNAMVLVKPATDVQWHRKGFRLYWRWRSRRPGRPKMSSEIRDLIRQMAEQAQGRHAQARRRLPGCGRRNHRDGFIRLDRVGGRRRYADEDRGGDTVPLHDCRRRLGRS